MSRGLTLAIDGMGGDNAPKMVVVALSRILGDHPDVRFLLFGREEELIPLVKRFPSLEAAVEVRNCGSVVGSGEKPSVALRTGRDSSMRLAIDAVSRQEADGVVSAGNTGALMAMAKYVLGTLPGIDRPAIAGLGPTMRGHSVMLDLGANIECSAENLVQFAVMGEVFARTVLGLPEPSVGILNVGEEELKGHDAVKRAASILHSRQLAMRFVGFVEGNDICEGTVDVVVTDGFTGNIALKSMEGAARLYTRILKDALSSSIFARIGALFAHAAFRRMRKRVDPRQYDGAIFLGLNGVCVKSHGGSDATGFANAVRVAIRLITHGVNEGIKEEYVSAIADGANGVPAAAP